MTEIEPEPSAAAQIFGDRIDLARRFTAALGEHGEERGLIGPLEPPRLWTRHVLNSAVIAPLFSRAESATSVREPACPGVVLAIARPDVEWVLIEPMERRVPWLTEQVDALGLEQRRDRASTRRGLARRTDAGCRHRARRERTAHARADHRAARAQWR